MREIKFRAWNKQHQIMVTWEQMKIDNIVTIAFCSNDSVKELMQFTGLQDKTGRDIYEGDIVKQDWVLGEPVYKNIEITWNQYICAFCTGSKPLQLPNQWIVIGNIYENPELLDK